ncbi:MAG: bifunctional phosphopantothenoylcysteine decarboxylase/phosphopantothenate--cysteine ligase CoaBC [Candidatus Hodarchaeales archaeon]|jgi:phosphopantothenoylcysteine decarboxylase/phosphopantothenate--cysteine ligase
MVDHLKDIKGSLSNSLLGRRIVLCITGSIAAIKCVELARLLIRHGAEVYTVMSKAAREIIHPYSMEWATGNAVLLNITGRVEHVELAGKSNNKADLILLAPATANTVGKIVAGIDDTPVTTVITTALGSKIPLVIVPGMHEPMYNNPFISKNLKILESTEGITVIKPVIEENKAKLANPDEIVEHVIRFLSPQDMAGKKVLITTGPTREYVDSVRFLSNPSSGKTGMELARQAWYRGAKVEIVTGPVNLDWPDFLPVTRVVSTQDMLMALKEIIPRWKPDVVIMAAAIADYTPEGNISEKIKSGQIKTLKLVPTEKIIDKVKELAPDSVLVGYKAETGLSEEDLLASARKKIEECEASFIVANFVLREKAGFATDLNKIYIVFRNSEELYEGNKSFLAEKIIAKVSNLLKN